VIFYIYIRLTKGTGRYCSIPREEDCECCMGSPAGPVHLHHWCRGGERGTSHLLLRNFNLLQHHKRSQSTRFFIYLPVKTAFSTPLKTFG